MRPLEIHPHADSLALLRGPDIDRRSIDRGGPIGLVAVIGQNLYGAFGVKRFSLSSGPSSILFKFLCLVGEPFLCPGLHPENERRGAAVNIAVGTAGGGAKRC